MTERPDFVLAAERSVACELLDRLVSELRLQRRPWMTYSEDEQREAIDRLRGGVEAGVTALTQVIVAGGRQTLTADIDRVSFSDSVKASLTLPRGNQLVHDLADRAGGQVVLVLVDPKQFAEGMDVIVPDTKQLDMMGDGEGGSPASH